MLYSMKETCNQTNMSYDTLKFYCNEGLIPNVKRDKNNYRVFDEHDIAWIKSLSCLKMCGMCKSQYNNVGLGQNNIVVFPTFLFCPNRFQ